MAGMVTWKRTSIPCDLFYRQRDGSLVTNRDVSKVGSPALALPVQETTSWRTGRGSPGENDEVIPTHRDDAFRAWWLENRDLSNPLDSGHPFSSTSQKYDLLLPEVYLRNSSGSREYRGPLYVDYRTHFVNGNHFPVPTLPDLNWYGSMAIQDTIPTKPAFDAAQNVGELFTEGLPTLAAIGALKSATLFFRSLGGNYLSLEFGWKPFVGSLRDLIYAVKNANKLLMQLERDSGRNVRRKRSFVPTSRVIHNITKTGSIANPSNSSVFLSLCQNNLSGQLSETLIEETSIRFSGAYRYYLHRGSSFWDKVETFEQKCNYLLGIRITPSVLWELAPWSWLVDWIAGVGSVFANQSALSNDSLVIAYGYLTCKTTQTRAVTVRGLTTQVGPLAPVTTIYRTTRIERIQATPFGFGLNPGSLTSRQKAILASLWQSRHRR